MAETSEPAAPQEQAETTATETTTEGAGATEPTSANAGETLLTGEGEAGNQEGETATDDQKAEDQPAEEGSEGGEVPESYDFSFPEGVEVDPDTVGELTDVAKELKLTQDQAQRIADLGAKQAERWAQAQQDALAKTEAEWVEQVKADEEIGGDKFDANLAVAVKALDQFGTPEFRDFLQESRLGNHPEMIRLMHRVGKTIADDSVVPGGRSTNQQADPAALFYPNSEHT